MRKIGIIGGLGPESTLDYYRGIIEAFRPTYEEKGYPEMVIESVNLKQLLDWAENDQWNKIVELLSQRCESLFRAGAAFGAITANTPHKVFHEIQERTQLPLLSIIKATRIQAQKRGLKKLLLLGTGFTMRSTFYQKEFSPHGIELVVPNEDDKHYIHSKIFSEIEMGILKESTKLGMLHIIERYKQDTDGVILGCTELPMIIKENDIDSAYLDTTQIHINAIVEHSLLD